MKLLRKVNVEKSAEYQLGDVLKFEMDGKTVEAFAVKQEEDGMIFLFRNCLDKGYPMRQAKAVLKFLTNEIPEELKEMLVPFESGEFFRLPTEKEIFGKNAYGTDEGENIQQWECMKERRNRITFDEGDNLKWYWLSNKVSATDFANVGYGGNASCYYASASGGIRPAFKIS